MRAAQARHFPTGESGPTSGILRRASIATGTRPPFRGPVSVARWLASASLLTPGAYRPPAPPRGKSRDMESAPSGKPHSKWRWGPQAMLRSTYYRERPVPFQPAEHACKARSATALILMGDRCASIKGATTKTRRRGRVAAELFHGQPSAKATGRAAKRNTPPKGKECLLTGAD